MHALPGRVQWHYRLKTFTTLVIVIAACMRASYSNSPVLIYAYKIMVCLVYSEIYTVSGKSNPLDIVQ